MKLIKERFGKSKRRGVTIHILRQKSKDKSRTLTIRGITVEKSRTLTIRGITVEEAFNQIKSYFQILENNPTEATISWRKKITVRH